MDAVEVDIELFVTCRLCLNEKGTYQIIPSVQQQIKYCFDINIDTFDGLPQLLCKKCKDILNDYHATKTKYRDIQDTLKDKLQKKLPITNIESSEVEKEANSTNRVEHPIEKRSSKEKKINHLKIRKKKLEVRKKRILSFSSSSSENPEPSENLNSLKHVKERQNTSQLGNDVRFTWEDNYIKCFVCHICKKECKELCDIETHIKTHKDLFMRHLNFFETECKVNLNKIDVTSNLTGLCTAVVHAEGLIVRYLDGFHYYIVYKNKEKLNVDYKGTPESCSMSNDLYNDSDRHDDTFRTKRKKCRLDSRSSNETVIIDNDITAQCASDDSVDVSDNGNKLKDDKRLVNEMPFIVLDDTSTESLCVNDTHPTNDIERANLINKTIKEVVGRTYNYLVSQDSNKSNKYRKKQIEHSESQLKHKLLSIGIKVITKQGFPCTGLLRFLKEKSLEVNWKPRIKVNAVNVRTYLKETPIVSDLWKNVAKSVLCKLEVGKTNVSVQNVKEENVRIDAVTAAAKDSDVDVKCASDGVERVNVYAKKSMDILTTNKLLNSNPVTNPKQLPKKSIEQKFVEKNTATVQNEALCIDLIDDTENFDFNHVPVVITKNSSDKSDKPEEVENQNNKTDNMPQQESMENCPTDLPKTNHQSAPRIKVKSFSELLSNEAINSMRNEPRNPVCDNNTRIEPRNPVPDNNMWQIYQPAQVSPVYQYQCQPPTQVVSDNSAAVGFTSQPQNVSTPTNQLPDLSASTSRIGFLVLHSQQMPKTITDSPFNYFRDLLRMNNIILMQTNSILSSAFKCVAKLKLTVRHDETIRLIKLSLWCYKNYVCINVIDEHNNPIDVNMTSIEWQWEILQVFKSDAVSKLYQCSVNLNGEVYSNIVKFKNILKSIERHPM